MDQYTGGNTTGFSSPAGDYLESRIDLTEILELKRPSRYLVKVKGNDLVRRGILSGDVLVVDFATAPTTGKIAVIMMNGEAMVGQLALRNGAWCLMPGREGGEPVKIEGDDAEIWAIAVSLVRPEL